MGDNVDQVQKVQLQIEELKEKSQSQLTLQQPASPTCLIRCQCCHVIGHSTNATLKTPLP